MNRICRSVLLPLALCAGLAHAQQAPQEVPLWPDGAPGFRHEHAETSEDKHETGRLDRYLGYVSNPTLTWYPAPGLDAAAPVVLVLPGGGFRYVAIDKEGHEVARWLNSVGISAAVLKYRVVAPDAERSWDVMSPLLALNDAGRAMRVLRSHAADWKIDPARIGVLGFSAGGTMAIRLTIDASDGKAGARDPVERLGSKPDFIGLIYASPPDNKMPKVDQRTPWFIAHAANDSKLPVKIATKVFNHIIDQGGSAELHVYRQGEHGFGVAPPSGTVRSWTGQFMAWLKDIGMAK
ncbi:alpha/beta hydrolase [Oxalobacteraceae bacterium A2-2]